MDSGRYSRNGWGLYRTHTYGGPGTFRCNCTYGTKQYSGWNTPRSAVGGVHSFGGQKYGYRTPGYGTKWGTNFAGGSDKHKAMLNNDIHVYYTDDISVSPDLYIHV